MLNVIRFREKASHPDGSRRRHPPANVDADISALALRIGNLQSKANGEIHSAILMLGLAAQHAREIANRMCDPTAKKNFEEHILLIEQLLELARDVAIKLQESTGSPALKTGSLLDSSGGVVRPSPPAIASGIARAREGR
jgi:hypothetical protein